MTPEQLAQAGEALFGPQWQTPMARSLGMNDAALVRKWLSGKTAMRPDTANRIQLLLTHDEWIVGDGATNGGEYIVHTRYPRFIARVASEDAGDGAVLCEFIWSDKPPVGDDLSRLLQRANAALEALGLAAMDGVDH